MSNKCLICGYDRFVERAHILPRFAMVLIQDYRDLAENDEQNIILLCRNHHWEYDHNLLSDNDYKIIYNEVIAREPFFNKYEKLIISHVVVEPNHHHFFKKGAKRVNDWIMAQRGRLETLGALIDNN